MFQTLKLFAVLLAGVQTAQADIEPDIQTDPATPAITEFSQLSVEQAAAPRCGVVFALVMAAQENNDERVEDWPKLEGSNAREFFVRSAVRLMDDIGLTREQVDKLMWSEARRLGGDNFKRVNELREPCLLMKQASGF